MEVWFRPRNRHRLCVRHLRVQQPLKFTGESIQLGKDRTSFTFGFGLRLVTILDVNAGLKEVTFSQVGFDGCLSDDIRNHVELRVKLDHLCLKSGYPMSLIAYGSFRSGNRVGDTV